MGQEWKPEPVQQENPEQDLKKGEELYQLDVEDSFGEEAQMESNMVGKVMQAEVPREEKQRKKPKENKGKFVWITVAAALVLFLVSAGLTGFLVSKNTDKKNTELKAEIAKELNTYLDFCNQAKDYKDQFAKFYLDDGDVSQLKENMDQAKNQIVNRESEEQLKQWLTKMKQFEEDTRKKNEEYTAELEQKFEAYNTFMMTNEELETYNDCISSFKDYVKKGEYAQAVSYANESYQYGEKVTKKKTGWNISVVQQDLSSYPDVRLYLEIKDDQGQVVENVDKKYFVLSEQQGSDTEYVRQKITKATQLNQKESLNISMVADVSGSMYENMDRVKKVMNNFLENVQFEVGDQIELSSFCDVFQIEEYFTSDRASLVSKVNELEADGGTKFYDSVIEAAQRVYLQEGARCVIAFTDGDDNCSTSNENDVIAYAKQYNVPIFIIGIGVGDYEDYTDSLEKIARETGGFYRSVEDVSESLEEVYHSIYRQQKEVYCVGYQTNAAISKAGTNNVKLYVKGEENGGMAEYSYTPKEDYFGVLLGKFLNAFSRSVENKKYSYLKNSDTLISNGAIATELKKYINRKDLEISQILHYEITSLDFSDENTCIMKTREYYDINQTKDYNADIKKQHNDKTDVDAVQIYDLLMERYYDEADFEDSTIKVKKTRVQKATYKLVREKNGNWKFKDYASGMDIESSNVYFSCVDGDEDNLE